MNYCPNCGARLKSGAKFCTECGTALPKIKSVPTVPAGQAELVNVDGAEKLAEDSVGNDDVETQSQTEFTSSPTPTADEPMPHPTVPLRSTATKINSKMPLLILGILALIGFVIFLICSNFSGPKEEIWSTNVTDDNPFAVTVVRNKDDFKASIQAAAYSYDDPFAQNFVVHLEGQLAKTDYDQTEHIQPQFISLEFNTAIIEQAFSEYFYGLDFLLNDTMPSENFVSQLMTQTLDQKKSTLTSAISVGLEEKKTVLAQYGSAQQMRDFDDLEKTTLGFIDGLYEHENGLGVRISLEQIKDLATIFGQIEPDDYSDVAMSLMLIENNLMFEQIDATTARFDIPFAGETIHFYKHTNN